MAKLIFRIFFLSGLISGCSFIEHRNEKSLQDNSINTNETVPRAQYEELLKRYKALALTSSFENANAQTKGPDGESAAANDNNEMAKTPLNTQIELFQRAQRFLEQDELSKALQLLQNLELSPHSQIALRAKYNIAQLVYKQGQFELALEIYEEILTKFPYSGFSVLSIAHIIDCASTLNMTDKKLEYETLYKEKYLNGFGPVAAIGK